MRLHKAAWWEVPHYWPAVSGWVQEALSSSLILSVDDLYSGCLKREMTLWLALDGEPRGAAVTKIERRPRVTLCVVIAAGGEGMKDWLFLKGGIEAHARDEGCKAIEAWGRRGWQRVLDYEPVFMVYRKVLSDG